jgi:prepilin-type N-terminal cleavage/methylation domain-containing protein
MRERVRMTAQDGFTLVEMLVVLTILGIVLAGLTVLFTGALSSQTDQTNRAQVQQDARLGLDRMRREIRCASDITTPSGYPASSVTITLASYCPTAGGATTVTWCTKDKNGATPPVAGAQPYTLWRYTGSTCSGTGTEWASDLVDKTDAPAITAGRIFDAARLPAASLTAASSGGTLPSGTYSYEVSAVLSSGVEVPGTVASLTVPSGLANTITVSWSLLAGATSYNVYGRDGVSLRLLKNTTGTSYVDTGPTKLADNPLTLPTATINVQNPPGTSNFNATANTIAFGASGPITCAGTTATSFTGCTGGAPGQYPQNMPVYSASTARPPSAALSVSLALDKTPANTAQRFVLTDSIALRNSRPS